MLYIIIPDEREYFKILSYKNIRPNYYEISNYGTIRRIKDKKVIKPFLSNSGYLRVGLEGKDKRKNYSIHVLVAYTFYPNINVEGMKIQVNHLDGNKFNLYYKNLEYTSQSVNIKHAYDTGLMKSGKDHHLGKYDDETIHKICKHLENGDEMYTIVSDILNNPNISRDSYEYKRMRSFVKKLRQKQFRMRIVSQYDF